MTRPTATGPLRLTAVAALLATGWACSVGDGLGSRDDATDTDTAAPVDTDGDADVDTGTPFPAEDAWWGLVGGVELLEGQVRLDGPELALSARNDGDTCDAVATLTGATPAAPPAPEVLAWWDVTVDATPRSGCAAWPGPRAWSFGLGLTTSALAPDAARRGLPLEALYGLYLRVDGGEAFLVGLAGTEAQLEGEAAPVDAAPLPDGVYVLHTLYGLPLTP